MKKTPRNCQISQTIVLCSVTISPPRILFLLSFATSLQAQRSEEATHVLSYIQKAMNFNKVVLQEKVYLHFDNMGYFENETMWFRVWW